MSTEAILTEALTQFKDEVIQRSIDAKAVASGETNKGYEVAVSGTSGEVYGYGYVGVLERGRKGGKVPYNFHLVIEKWIKDKGLAYQDDKDLARMARSIAWVIMKQGTYLHRHGYEIDIFDTPTQHLYEYLEKNMSAYYENQITKSIYE